MPTMGPLNRRMNEVSQQKNEYLQHAKEDIEMRRAAHNSQLKVMQKEEKAAKRKVWCASIADRFSHIGERVGKMGPQP